MNECTKMRVSRHSGDKTNWHQSRDTLTQRLKHARTQTRQWQWWGRRLLEGQSLSNRRKPKNMVAFLRSCKKHARTQQTHSEASTFTKAYRYIRPCFIISATASAALSSSPLTFEVETIFGGVLSHWETQFGPESWCDISVSQQSMPTCCSRSGQQAADDLVGCGR